jgi:hypothetical protein
VPSIGTWYHDGVDESRAAGLAERWKKTLRGLDGRLRIGYLKSEVALHPLPTVAEALDLVCAASEQAEPDARDLLVALVDLIAERERLAFAQALREEATGRSLLSLGRLLRRPSPSAAPPSMPPTSGSPRVPDYGSGRTLTLGERKALARRPTRKSLDKLLGDPHPMVIRLLLANPKLVENDVVRLAARRPGNPEVLAEIVRSPWSHRVRVRMALVQNPDSPPELSIPMLSLLVRPELRQVVEASFLLPAIRAAAHELLARRPPVRSPSVPPKLQ